MKRRRIKVELRVTAYTNTAYIAKSFIKGAALHPFSAINRCWLGSFNHISFECELCICEHHVVPTNVILLYWIIHKHHDNDHDHIIRAMHTMWYDTSVMWICLTVRSLCFSCYGYGSLTRIAFYFRWPDNNLRVLICFLPQRMQMWNWYPRNWTKKNRLICMPMPLILYLIFPCEWIPQIEKENFAFTMGNVEFECD